MGALISRTRDRIRDTGSPPHFADQEIQDVLDTTRQTVRLWALQDDPILTGAGGIQWFTYLAPVGDWEAGVTVQNNAWVPLTLTTDYTFDDITGTVTLVVSAPPPTYLSGQTYDLAAAAAILLERWAGDLDAAFDFHADGARYSRSQQAAGKRLQAARERMGARHALQPFGGAERGGRSYDYARTHRIGGWGR